MKYLFCAVIVSLIGVNVASAADKPSKKEAEAAQMIQQFDKNGDGALDATELGAAIAAHKEAHAQKKGKVVKAGKGPAPEELIKRFDSNGDGKLNAAELNTMLQTLHDEHHKKAN
jgi:Ca2+-binding EF-hand superfamily protein